MTQKARKEEIIKFKDFVLDSFQIEAIQSIDNHHSVVVSAATGTGKTLIADYIIDKFLKKDKKIIYTAPIKALSNQKYRDFKEQYGEENVGILTGDVTINPDAPLRIMTTEIYRNMLLSNDSGVDDVAYVIFDEIHYLGDIERGTVWEESIIFSKEHTRFLCLSATIPNSRQFANWIQFIKKHNVDVVVEKKRAVPLQHSFYDTIRGFTDIKELKYLKGIPSYNKSWKNKKKRFREMSNRKRLGTTELLRTVEQKNNLPCIYFCFSRALTEKKAKLLMKKRNYLSGAESIEVRRIYMDKLKNTDKSVFNLQTTKTLRQCLSNGIGFHHAGILPVLKEIVEKLFEKGLVKVLFATETFAVGINMPARTVCFDSLEKYDGIQFRYLYSKEYFQLAGRAGRRGIDKVGYVISVVDSEFADLQKIRKITEDDTDPLQSQFKLSINTVLNLIYSHSKEEQDIILKSSFYSYQMEGRTQAGRILHSFEKRKKELIRKGYVTNNDELTEKGLFGMKIYTEELVVTEIFCSSLTDKLTDVEILLLVGSIAFEERKNIRFKGREKNISRQIFNKIKDYPLVRKYNKDNPTYKMETFLKRWYEGCEFIELLEYTNMPEGDIVRFIRQMIDLIQQIEHATLNANFRERIKLIKSKIDRDVIAVRF